MGGKLTFLKISQNKSQLIMKSNVEQDYALQSFTLLLWLKVWLIQTVELLTLATVNIVIADNKKFTATWISWVKGNAVDQQITNLVPRVLSYPPYGAKGG